MPTKLRRGEIPECLCGRPADALAEVEEGRDHYVPRCIDHMETPADGREPRFDAEAKQLPPAFQLTRQERKAILAGELTKLRRKGKPDVKAGEVQVVAWSRGGKQFVSRSEAKRWELAEKGKPVTIDIPREPTVWLLFREPQLRDGEWETSFERHDKREPVRTLARVSAAAGSSEAGLKTRWGERVDAAGEVHERRVPKRGEQSESWTPLSELGYGGGGKSIVDKDEAPDPAYLAYDRMRREVDLRNAQLQGRNRQREGKMAAEFKLAREHKQGKPGKLREAKIARDARRLDEAA